MPIPSPNSQYNVEPDDAMFLDFQYCRGCGQGGLQGICKTKKEALL